MDGASAGNVYTNNCGGMFGLNWGSDLSSGGCPDGTSNTVMLNHLRIGVTDKDRRGTWAMGTSGASITAAHGIVGGDCTVHNDNREKSDDTEDCSQVVAAVPSTTLVTMRMGCSYDNAPNNWPNFQAQARSCHPGCVIVAMGDGSVRIVKDSIDQETWRRANSRNDGLLYNFDQ